MALLSKPILLDRDRQMVTRFQDMRIRSTFPFLSLPAELRNMIYELSVNVSGIEQWFNAYYDRIREAKNVSKVPTPDGEKHTPTLFLINRQIFAESVRYLQRQHVTFSHGLLDVHHVTHVASESLLRTISSITITTSGHPTLKSNILGVSWSGYIYLINQLAEILCQGHKLKDFNLYFHDPEVCVHLCHCWHRTNQKCDFRDQVSLCLDNLRRVRNVGTVTLHGLPENVALEVKARMESKPATFLCLPAELRNKIYDLSLDWSDANQALQRSMDDWVDQTQPIPYPSLSTPSILLVCKQITAEALTVLHAKPLRLVCAANPSIQKWLDMPILTRFVSASTLRTTRHLHISIKSWEWIHPLSRVLHVLATKHSLVTLRFGFRDAFKPVFLAAMDKTYPDPTLHAFLAAFLRIRGVKEKVEFEGDLPRSYTFPMAQFMLSTRAAGYVEGTEAMPLLLGVRGDGLLADVEGHGP